MKYTEKTQEFTETISRSISIIECIYDKDTPNFHSDSNTFLRELEKKLNDLLDLNWKDIDREFWDICNDLHKIKQLKRVFEVKFEKILNWRNDLSHQFYKFLNLLYIDIDQFIEKEQKREIKYSEEQKNELTGYYWETIFILKMTQAHIQSLINQWDAMSLPSNNFQQLEITQEITKSIDYSPKFKLATKKKTVFIEIISAMYDAQIFEMNHGRTANNKQEMMEELGRLFGFDIAKYITSLSLAK